MEKALDELHFDDFDVSDLEKELNGNTTLPGTSFSQACEEALTVAKPARHLVMQAFSVFMDRIRNQFLKK